MRRSNQATLAPNATRPPGWNQIGDQLTKSFVTDDFRCAVLFVERVAIAADAVGRYPHISIDGGSVAIGLPLDRGSVEPAPAGTLPLPDRVLIRRIERLTGDQHRHPAGMAGL
jgi:pterin-4a-carbinolamine dehydratase